MLHFNIDYQSAYKRVFFFYGTIQEDIKRWKHPIEKERCMN